MAEPLSDRQLEILGQEIAIPLQVHAAGPIAQLAQRNAWASLNYLITKYQELRAVAAQRQTEIDQMRPIVEAVASHQAFPAPRSGLYMCLFCTGAAGHIADIQHDANCLAEQARAFLAAGQAAEGEGE